MLSENTARKEGDSESSVGHFLMARRAWVMLLAAGFACMVQAGNHGDSSSSSSGSSSSSCNTGCCGNDSRCSGSSYHSCADLQYNGASCYWIGVAPPPPQYEHDGDASGTNDGGYCRSLDVVFLLDRSSAVTEDNWNEHVLPFTAGMIESISPSGSGSTGTRAGIVVFPAATEGTTGDTSGTAAARVQMTYDKDVLLGALDDAEGHCSDYLAATGLRFPCSSMDLSPTWNALAVAEEMLYSHAPSDRSGATKIVIIVTATAPSSTKGGKHFRASYLTLAKANELKHMENPTSIMAVGYGHAFSELDSDCDPFCEEGGEGLFAGHDHSGRISFVGVDNSQPFCDGDGGCGFSSDVQEDSLVSGGCSNECPYRADGECDDGGPGYHYNVCPYGSDCVDCGTRGELKASYFWVLSGASSLTGITSAMATEACSSSAVSRPPSSPSPPPPPPPSSPSPPPLPAGPCALPHGSGGETVTEFSVITESYAVIESHNHDNGFAIGGSLYSGYSSGMSKTVHGNSWVGGGIQGGGFIFKNGVQTNAGQPFEEKMTLFKQLTSTVKASSHYVNGQNYQVQVWDQGGDYDPDAYVGQYSRGGEDQEEVSVGTLSPCLGHT